MLNEQERRKYDRQILLDELGEDGQVKLKKAKVLVVGAGGLGCAVLPYLVAAGVGTIGILDFDSVDESNLQRQVLFNEDDIGKQKAQVAADKLKKQNSLVTVIPHLEKLTSENAEQVFKKYELVVDCTDNFNTRYLINDACVLSGKPMVYGAVHRFEGQVSVFNLRRNHSAPTYRCLFPVPPSEGEIPSCAEAGVLGVLPGIIGLLQATEVIKIITGIGEILSGRLLCFDALCMKTTLIEIERNPIIEKATPSSWDELRETNYNFDCDRINKDRDLSARQIEDVLSKVEEVQFLDVRNEDELPVLEEFQGLRIPLTEIKSNLSKIFRDKKVIVFCKSGQRSLAAIRLLQREYHFTNLYQMKGGMDEWLRFKGEVNS